jgi:hypothetical protein
MAMLARLAGEEALQTERTGLIAADEVREGDSHDFPSSRAGHPGFRRERPDLRESGKGSLTDFSPRRARRRVISDRALPCLAPRFVNQPVQSSGTKTRNPGGVSSLTNAF